MLSIFVLPPVWQISHPYTTTGKIIVLCIVFFKFLEKRCKTKILNRMVASISRINLLLISSWIQFLCVVPKYVNYTTFSKNLLAMSELWFFTAFWWRDITMFLVFCVLTSRQASYRASVFFFMVFFFPRSVLTSSACTRSWCVSFISSPSWLCWTFLIAHSKESWKAMVIKHLVSDHSE